MKTEGYLFCSFGDINYAKMVNRLIKQVRGYDKMRPICVLTDDFSKNVYIEENDIEYKYIDIESHMHASINMNIQWNRFGLIPKIYQYLYTPFENTCFIDADMVFHNDFTFIWKMFYDENVPLLMPGLCDEQLKSPAEWHWGYIHDVIHHCGFNVPQVWSTMFIYNTPFKNILKEEQLIEYCLDNLHHWNVRIQFRDNGITDEIIYAFILGKIHVKPNSGLHQWLHDENNCTPFEKEV